MIFIGDQAKKELWDERIDAFLASDLSQRAWCAQHGLKAHQLSYWLSKRNRSNNISSANKWVSLESAASEDANIVVQVGELKVAVTEGFDQRVLADVLRVCLSIC